VEALFKKGRLEPLHASISPRKKRRTGREIISGDQIYAKKLERKGGGEERGVSEKIRQILWGGIFYGPQDGKNSGEGTTPITIHMGKEEGRS